MNLPYKLISASEERTDEELLLVNKIQSFIDNDSKNDNILLGIYIKKYTNALSISYTEQKYLVYTFNDELEFQKKIDIEFSNFNKIFPN